uniref:Metalloendopeptidase n=1 Tax=Romanomermis culicivorax TaxID=13658 RepID=A0A915L5V3_ROMCU
MFYITFSRMFTPPKILGKKAVVRSAFNYWQELTCLKFQELNDEPSPDDAGPFLRIIADNGFCYSYIGAVEPGQIVSLGDGCVYLAIAGHEIGHALGLWLSKLSIRHEQSRPDRDDYVLINAENIDPADLDQFDKTNVSTVRSSITPYDHGSVMHYGAYDFAIDESKPVIITKKSLYMKTIGQRDELSFYDAKAINKMYCDDECNVTLPCERDGYTDPKNCSKCRCPEGFTGRFCEKVLHTGYKVCSPQNLIAKNEWQNFRINGHVECNFFLKANNSKRIQINIRANRSSFVCEEVCTSAGGYVEVRYEDQLTFGPRLCCIPPLGATILTEKDKALIMYRGRKTASVMAPYSFGMKALSDKIASAFSTLAYSIDGKSLNASSTRTISNGADPPTKSKKIDFFQRPFFQKFPPIDDLLPQKVAYRSRHRSPVTCI